MPNLNLSIIEYLMAERVEYTLWVMPKDEIYASLKALIDKLSIRYKTISFDPYVTVEGDLYGSEDELVRRTSLLASSLHPYPVQLTRIGYTDQFFRALFFRVKETREVKEANRKAREVFGLEDGPYMPHLSILYGNIPLEEKRKTISEIGRNANVRFEVDSIHLYRIEYGADPNSWRAMEVRGFALG